MENRDDLQDIRRHISMYFDHALSTDEEKSLLARVETDPAYHRVFTQEKFMREHIKQNLHRPGVSPDLIQTIKNNIRMT